MDKVNKSGLMVIFMSILLTFAIMAFASETAFAEEVASGTCGAEGDNLTWSLDDEGTLTINGEGEMADWTAGGQPWETIRNTINKLVIGEGVTSIGNYAFYRCVNLSEISFSDSITRIGQFAFQNCAVTSIDISDNVETIGNNAFRDCTELKNASITDGADNLFNGCIRLETVVFKEGAKQIGYSCFSGCLSLETITVPGTIENFSGMYVGLDEEPELIGPFFWENGILYSEDKSKICFANDNINPDFTVSDTVKVIGDSAFFGNSTLEKIVIPEGVTLGKSAFSECENLTEVILPEGLTEIPQSTFTLSGSLTTVNIPDSVKTIGAGAFSSTAITEIIIPEGITVLEENVCRSCSQLKTVSLPSTLTTIGDGAFASCQKLTQIEIPDTVNEIGVAAFSGSGLKSVTIPDGVTEIKESAFRGGGRFGVQLESVVIPKTVTKIGKMAFNEEDNTVLKNVYYRGTKEEWDLIEYETWMWTGSYHQGEVISKPDPDLSDRYPNVVLHFEYSYDSELKEFEDAKTKAEKSKAAAEEAALTPGQEAVNAANYAVQDAEDVLVKAKALKRNADKMLKDAEESVKDADKNVASRQKELDDINNTLASLQQELDDLQAAASEEAGPLEEEYQEVQDQFMEALMAGDMEQIMILGPRMEELDAEIQAIYAKYHIAEAQEKLLDAETEKTNAETLLQAAEKRAERIAEVLADAEERAEAAANTLEAAETALIDAKLFEVSVISDKQIAELTKTLTDLQDQLDALEDDSVKKEELQEEIDNLTDQIDTLKKRIEDLEKDSVTKKELETAIASLNSTIVALNDEISQLKGQIADLIKDAATKTELEEALGDANKIIEDLQKELDKLKESSSTDEDTIKALEKQITDLKNELKEKETAEQGDNEKKDAAIADIYKYVEDNLANFEKADKVEIEIAVLKGVLGVKDAKDQVGIDKAVADVKTVVDEKVQIKAAKDAAKALKVTGVKARSKKLKFTVSWKKVKGAEKYQVQYQLKGKKKWTNLTKSTAKLKVISKKLKKSKKYIFRVRTIVKVNDKAVYGKWAKSKAVKAK